MLSIRSLLAPNPRTSSLCLTLKVGVSLLPKDAGDGVMLILSHLAERSVCADIKSHAVSLRAEVHPRGDEWLAISSPHRMTLGEGYYGCHRQ